MPENPELFGMGAILVALITAWAKMRPAMKKIEADEDASLRNDLLKRIEKLEIDNRSDRDDHKVNLAAVRAEYDALLQAAHKRYDDMCTAYELKLLANQEQIDKLMNILIKEH